MSDKSVSPIAGLAATTPRLEPGAVSVAQHTLIGLADTGPTVSVVVLAGPSDRRDGLRGPSRARADRDPDADHRERIPEAEPIERQLRCVV
jgi:hypothetical protein